MIVRVEQENVLPLTQSSSASDPCMVLRGGAIIPASLQTFPGMEHDRGLFNGMSQETSSNGISQILDDPNSFDDERELEAAAAESEAQMKAFAASAVIVASPTPPVAPTVTPLMPSNQTFSPLHISIGDNAKCSEASSMVSNKSKDSDSSSNGYKKQKKPFQPPPLRNIRDCPSNRPSTSAAPPPIVMGPPTNSNAPVLLSPAGNLNNGFHRISSGDSAPSSPSVGSRSLSKGGQFMHPLSAQRSLPSSRMSNSSVPASPVTNRSTSSTTSPQSSGRKDHEVTKRKHLVEIISKSRGPEFVHMLPQLEGLTPTQMSIMLRRNRSAVANHLLPHSVQQMIETGFELNSMTAELAAKIKEANRKRTKNNDFEDLTDLSDLEEDFECYKSQERKKGTDEPRWAPKRMRYSGMLSRAEVLLAEKTALMGMLKDQMTVMDASTGVRFIGEEEVVRRRRQLNGTYYLFRKHPLVRSDPERFGCSRTMPIQSWVKRKPHKDVFEDATDDRSKPTVNTVVKPSIPGDKWVQTAQYSIVSYLTGRNDTREVTEYDYEEFKIGDGMQQVNELSAFDPLDFVVTSDFSPFEERQMEYMYRMSTAPSCTIRKKHGRSIYFETDDRRNPSDRTDRTKKKTDRKKERKRVEDASSDEETWVTSKIPAKKRSRGRPAATPGRKKPVRTFVPAKQWPERYLDYLFDDINNEEFNPANLPPPQAFTNIHVPEYYKVPENFLDDAEPSAPEVYEDLKFSVARGHHTLMHTERNRIKREYEKRNRNRQSSMKSAASTPSQNSDPKDAIPPFDIHMFDPHHDPSRRRFLSVVKPFEQRDFLSKPVSPKPS